jgi:DNA repair protein RecO
MITHTKIVVLRMVDYQESSKILTVLSKEHGKIALIAKGAKRPKNKLAGTLENGAVLDVVYYYKQSRSVQTLTEASIHYTSNSFRKDFSKAAILYASLELVGQLVHEHEVNSSVFEFMATFIQWLGDTEVTNPSVFPYVQLRLAEMIGLGLICQINEIQHASYLNITNGNISDDSEEELSYKLSSNQSRFLLLALTSKSASVLKSGLENGELRQLVNHLDVYFKYHIDGYKDRRSDAIFEQML